MKDPKVKIIAMASNEAYYLPQWIHHHLYFGFNAFDIYFNRSTDNTMSVLEKLRSYYHNISIYNVDWIDSFFSQSPPSKFMNSGPYMHSYFNLCSDFDYVLFLDIDEFWMPRNGIDSIQKCIREFNFPNCILFEWFFIGGFEEYKLPLLSNKTFYGYAGGYTKALFKTGLEPISINAHIPAFKLIDHIITGNGEQHIPYFEDINAIHPSQRSTSNKYFILHDAIRSLPNNFSKFVRGATSGSKRCNSIQTIANLRPPYYQMEPSPHLSRFDSPVPGDYFKAFARMSEELDLASDYPVALENELLNALNFIRLISDSPDSPMPNEIAKKLGSFDVLHRALLEKLGMVNSIYREFANYTLSDLGDIFYPFPAKFYENFLVRIKLYPYAFDEDYQPLFLKQLLQYLLKSGNSDKARELMNRQDLLSIMAFGTQWAAPLFAQYFIDNHMLDNALQLSELLAYSGSTEIFSAISKLNNEKKINRAILELLSH